MYIIGVIIFLILIVLLIGSFIVRSRKINLFEIICLIVLIGSGVYLMTFVQDFHHDPSSNHSCALADDFLKDLFNGQLDYYLGENSGANVKSLMNKLLSNVDAYDNEPNKVVDIMVWDKTCEDGEARFISYMYDKNNIAEAKKKYVEEIIELRKEIELKHTYKVDMLFDRNEVNKLPKDSNAYGSLYYRTIVIVYDETSYPLTNDEVYDKYYSELNRYKEEYNKIIDE